MSASNGVSSRATGMPQRTEVERQALIAELRELRAVGVNVKRQEAIETVLRAQFELGWPDDSKSRSRKG